MRYYLFVAVLSLCSVQIFQSDALGQGMVSFPQFTQTGVITRLALTAVELRNKHSEVFMISLLPRQGHSSSPLVQIVVHATMSHSGLKAGMTVKFQAVIGDDGTVAGEVTKLVASTQKSRKKFAPTRVVDANLPQGTVLVVGSVRTLKTGKLTVSIKDGDVTATVPDHAEIKVEGVDPKLVRPGDKIYARGFSRAPSMQAPTYYAQFVSIELADPVDQRVPAKK